MTRLQNIVERFATLVLGPVGRAAIIGTDDDAMLVARPHVAVAKRRADPASINHITANPRYL